MDLFQKVILSCFVASLSAATCSPAAELRIRVSAGDFDRQDTIVSFALPDGKASPRALRAANGEYFQAQVDEDGRAWFVLRELARGESIELIGVVGGERDPLAPWVETVPENGRLRISIAGNPAVYYQAEERDFPRPGLNPLIKRGGFLHPIISPAGVVVSESYSIAHPHHHGIWTSWSRAVFEGRRVDFWNMHAGTGKVEPDKIARFWSGPVHGGFVARHRFIDLTVEEPKVALNESWTVRVFQAGNRGENFRVFELIKLQECATESPLQLLEHIYGGLGFRGRDEWSAPESAVFLTSEGITDRAEGNRTRPRWTYVGGIIGGETAGIAILGHPESFRAPQPARLHPEYPFFCYAPPQLGDWEITPEHPYKAAYRFVVKDGKPDAERIDRWWNDFAHPPAVEILN